MRHRYLARILMGSFIILVLVCSGGYIYWNTADPRKTCASCHEISNSVSTFHDSAHRNIACHACHGTALSNGLHSLAEKANMVFTHLGDQVHHDDIRLKEKQVLEVHDACIHCHQSEYANWSVGGHSATYVDIFLDPNHNKMEAPYPDCLRCHGMYYDGNIQALMQPVDNMGLWYLKEEGKGSQPTIPCLSCHQIHAPNEILSEVGMDANDLKMRNPFVFLYMRSNKMHLRSDKLMKPRLHNQEDPVLVSDDYSQRVCVHCHSPNAIHEVGTEDDRTPIGVHEGLSCSACHEPHSNSAAYSCVKCHPAISNCKVDVLTMDTTYANPASANNIHFVSCADCHGNNDARLRIDHVTIY